MGVRTKILISLIVILTAAAIGLSLPFVWLGDGALDYLLRGTLFRLCAGGAGVCIIFLCGYQKILKFSPRGILWCVPCFLVALVNFPYGALISGSAYIERVELLPLLILFCFAIALLEEAVFRGVLFGYLKGVFKNNRYGNLWAVLISAIAFALWHLLNLFNAGVGETLLQVGYTFLTGAMFAAVMLRTENLWLCILIHAVFDFGGLIVPLLGYGAAHDISFWVLTAVAGVVCLIHVLYFLLKKKN